VRLILFAILLLSTPLLAAEPSIERREGDAPVIDFADPDLPELPEPYLRREPKWSIVWALLPPRFEVDRRLGDSPLWLGGRVQFLNMGFNADSFQGSYFGVAALAHYRIEDPSTWYYGADFYGGFSLDYSDIIGRGGAPGVLAPATVVGISGRLAWFQLGLEAHVLMQEGKMLPLLFPALEIRHTF
jgi:hypothetical protein